MHFRAVLSLERRKQTCNFKNIIIRLPSKKVGQARKIWARKLFVDLPTTIKQCN